MSLIASIADSPTMAALGAIAGTVLGPGAAAAVVTVPDRHWPWQSAPRWWLGEPATARRRVLLTLAGAVVLGSLGAVIGWRPAAVSFLGVGILGLTLAAIDLQHHRLPDRLILTGAGASALALLVDAMVMGSWSALIRGLGCAVVAGALFLVMAMISPAGMGLGDVKLGALLSLHTGWLAWQLAIIAMLCGFVIGALGALLLVAVGRATLRTAIPFGPALLLGAWLVVLSFGSPA